MKCVVCGKHEATIKDYRETAFGTVGSVPSCKWCFSLSDTGHHHVKNENMDPKDFYDKKSLNK
jgi:hypothetical protein